MNRTGLFIALNLAFVVGLLFGIYPELDLKLAALFYDPATKSFPLKQNTLAALARDGAMWIAWGFAVPAIVALVAKLVRPDRRLLISGRAMIFLLMTLFLSAGVLTNFTFKSYWGRPRPAAVTQFNGTEPFMPWWDPRGTCDSNCSFVSGETSSAVWMTAPAMLVPPPWRYVALGVVGLYGTAVATIRMLAGGHFLSDVIFAAIFTGLVIWTVHGFLFRWPATRTEERALDAVLAKFGRAIARFFAGPTQSRGARPDKPIPPA